MVDRAELLDRIRKGEQYLERTDLTDEQRAAAKERYCNLVALLGTMPEEPDEKPNESANSTQPDVQKVIDEIWRKLDPEGKRRKRA